MKTHSIFLILIYLTSMSTLAEEPSFKQRDGGLECPKIPLLREASKELRRLSLNSVDESFFLSDQYCMLLAGVKLETQVTDFPVTYDKQQLRTLQENYQRAYSSISNEEDKILFVHMFLHILSHRVVVAPESFGEHKTNIVVAARTSKDKKAAYHLRLTPDMSYEEALNRLNRLLLSPPSMQDVPNLMNLVYEVLDVEKRMSDDEVYTLVNKL